MTTAERNKHLRELADDIAAVVAPVIGLDFTPKCHRITRRRGFGYAHQFSVPVWAAEGPTEYFVYYVAHEVCHSGIAGAGHGPVFKAREIKALAAVGLKPVYEKAGAGPYVEELQDLSGKPLVKRRGNDLPIVA